MFDLEKFFQDNPKFKSLFANTLASKLIQVVKDNGVERLFGNERFADWFRSLPKSMQVSSEWGFHFASALGRDMPNRTSVVGIITQEVLTESLTQTAIKFNELSNEDRNRIIVSSVPVVHGEVVREYGKDNMFRSKLSSFFEDMAKICHEAEEAVDKTQENINQQRAARKAVPFWRRVLSWPR